MVSTMKSSVRRGGIEKHLAQSVSLVLEVVGVACSSCVTHVSELARFSVVQLVEQLGRHGTVEDKVSVVELDSFESLVSSWHTLWDLSVTDTVRLAVLEHVRIESSGHIVIGVCAVGAKQATACRFIDSILVHNIVIAIRILVNGAYVVAMLVKVRSGCI
jgi:hypothetical protein